MSTTSVTYRNETYLITFSVGAISTTNRLQCALGIIRNYFDFTTNMFRWNVVMNSLSATSMYVMVEANGSNIVTALGISYLVSSNLLFDLGYVAHTFAATDDVYTGSGNNNNCIGNPQQSCSRTPLTVNYAASVIKDTTKSVQLKVWVTGVAADTNNNADIGWRITSANPTATSFSINVDAIGKT